MVNTNTSRNHEARGGGRVMAVTNKSNKQVGCLSGVFFTTHYFCLEKRPE